MAVLTGDSATTGGKPVLQSDSNSKVFIYYTDHGATGLVAMPTGRSLYADELQAAIDTMEANQMYDEVVFYLEACESGSMFPDLKASQKVYAMTASNASLSSWAAYCGVDARAEGHLIRSCLGDEFSVSWMEDTDSHDISVETLQDQYETTLTLTTQSPVQKFGDFDFMSDAIGVFEGTLEETSVKQVVDEVTEEGHGKRKGHFKKWGKKMLHKFEQAGEKVKEFINTEFKPVRKIDSRDVRFTQAFENYLESGTAADF